MSHENEAAIPNTGAEGSAATPQAARVHPTPRVTSSDLFRGGRELEIEHNGRRYQLRITQTGKLILTA
jgi:hemin uptake protein HemP